MSLRLPITKLREAIETRHKCKAIHVESEMVVEFFRDSVAWNGIVEIFNLEGHPKAKRCYAWSYLDKNDTQYATVLEIPPVNLAQARL